MEQIGKRRWRLRQPIRPTIQVASDDQRADVLLICVRQLIVVATNLLNQAILDRENNHRCPRGLVQIPKLRRPIG